MIQVDSPSKCESNKTGCIWSAISILVFVISSLAPLVWAASYDGYRYIGGADYPPLIGGSASIYSSFYPFNHLNAAGVDQAFLMSAIPHHLFYYVLEQFGVTPLIAAISLLCLLIFIAQLSFYSCLKHFAKLLPCPIFLNWSACVLGAIIYAYSPYVISLIIPGHIMTLFVYSAFPLIIYYLDKLLAEAKLNITLVSSLFLVFVFCSPGFGNIGIIYVLLVAKLIYGLASVLVYKYPLKRSFFRFCFVVALLFLANAWWLAPHLSNFARYVALSQSSATSMVNLVAYASQKATVANFFQGKPEGMMYMSSVVGNSYYANSILSVIFLLTMILLVFAVFKKNKKARIMLLSVLASILFAKGVQPPFSELFLWAYDHVPGFQVFRRPVSKFYGFFLFFLISGASLGLVILIGKYNAEKGIQRFLILVPIAAASYLISIFAQTPSLVPFNIPDMYFSASKYLSSDQVQRALIVPGRYGLNPVYRKDINAYEGQDFINEIFRFSKIEPDSTTNSLNEPYKKQANAFVEAIRSGYSICQQSKFLGISHVVVRDDLVISTLEDSPRSIIATLDKYSNLERRVDFKENESRLVVYKIKDVCTDKLLHLNGDNSTFNYHFINPGKIVVDIDGLRGKAELIFLENYSKNWELFVDDQSTRAGGSGQELSISGGYADPGSWKRSIEEMLYLFKSTPFESTHSVAHEYANSWIIDPQTLKPGMNSKEFMLDGLRNVRLVLFYRPQAFFYLGLIITLGALLLLLAGRFYFSLDQIKRRIH